MVDKCFECKNYDLCNRVLTLCEDDLINLPYFEVSEIEDLGDLVYE